jgi:hypothetical protein
VSALALLAAWAEIPREPVVEYFLWLAQEGLEREPNQVWDSLVAESADIEALVECCGRVKSGHMTAGPRLHVVELSKAPNPLKVPFVVGHENTAGFSAREREQDVIGERFRDAGNFQSFLSRHFCEQIPGSVPGIGRRRDCSIRSLKDFEDVPLQRPPILGPLHAGPQLLGDDHAEMLKRRKGTMELLELLVDNRIAKGVDEELSVENVLA